MKVTKIQAQVKTKGRYSIYIDKVYSFSLSELALINSGLKVGQELNKQEVEAYKDESSADKLYNRTLALLARRPRSEWEIKEYLRRKSDNQSHIEKILNTLSNDGYINDEDFARRWVESRRLLKPISSRKLRLELTQKCIPDALIAQVLAEDETDEFSVLKELIAKKRTQSRYQDDLKLIRYLTGQGFKYGDIKKALEDTD